MLLSTCVKSPVGALLVHAADGITAGSAPIPALRIPMTPGRGNGVRVNKSGSFRTLADVLGMLAAERIGVAVGAAVGRSVAASTRFRKTASVDPLEPSAPMGIKVGREVDGDWERHGRKLERSDSPDGRETEPAHRFHSPGHAHWVTIHGHAVYIDDAGLFHLHGKDNPGTRPGDANWHAWTESAGHPPTGSGPGKDGKAGTSGNDGDASPSLVLVECPTIHGLSQLGNGDELFSLSSTPSGGDGVPSPGSSGSPREKARTNSGSRSSSPNRGSRPCTRP